MGGLALAVYSTVTLAPDMDRAARDCYAFLYVQPIAFALSIAYR